MTKEEKEKIDEEYKRTFKNSQFIPHAKIIAFIHSTIEKVEKEMAEKYSNLHLKEMQKSGSENKEESFDNYKKFYQNGVREERERIIKREIEYWEGVKEELSKSICNISAKEIAHIELGKWKEEE